MGTFINFAEIGGYVICIIDLGENWRLWYKCGVCVCVRACVCMLTI